LATLGELGSLDQPRDIQGIPVSCFTHEWFSHFVSW
jgi:hypothetical protein